MKSHPFFQRRHYEAIATVMFNHLETINTPEHGHFIQDLCIMFHRDNNHFDEQRFLTHAGLIDDEGEMTA